MRSRLIPFAFVWLVATGVVLMSGATTADEPKLRTQDWAMFRGDAAQRGIARSSLPAKPKVLWTFEAPEGISSTAAVTEESVYVGCEDGGLYCLKRRDGSLRWKYQTPDMIQASPTVAGGLVFVGDSEGVMHAVDAASGKLKWKFTAGGQIISSANLANGGDGNDDRIVFGSYDGVVYCLEARSGELAWKFETGGRVHGTPAVVGSMAIAAGCDEELHVIRIADGKQQRAVHMQSVSGASAAVDGSLAYVGTYGGQVLCIDWRKGEIKWRYDDPDKEYAFMSSAAIIGDLVLVGSRDKHLYALDRSSGSPRWRFQTKGRIDSSPVVVGDRVYFGSADGVLYGLTVAGGVEVWRFETGSAVSASPAIAHGVMVIGTLDGALYCFGKKAE